MGKRGVESDPVSRCPVSCAVATVDGRSEALYKWSVIDELQLYAFHNTLPSHHGVARLIGSKYLVPSTSSQMQEKWRQITEGVERDTREETR